MSFVSTFTFENYVRGRGGVKLGRIVKLRLDGRGRGFFLNYKNTWGWMLITLSSLFIHSKDRIHLLTLYHITMLTNVSKHE